MWEKGIRLRTRVSEAGPGPELRAAKMLLLFPSLAGMTQPLRVLAFCTMQAQCPHSANPEMLGRRRMGRVSVWGWPPVATPRTCGRSRGLGGRRAASRGTGLRPGGHERHPLQKGRPLLKPYCVPSRAKYVMWPQISSLQRPHLVGIISPTLQMRTPRHREGRRSPWATQPGEQ